MRDGIHPSKDNPCESCKFVESCKYATVEYEVEDCGEWATREKESEIYKK